MLSWLLSCSSDAFQVSETDPRQIEKASSLYQDPKGNRRLVVRRIVGEVDASADPVAGVRGVAARHIVDPKPAVRLRSLVGVPFPSSFQRLFRRRRFVRRLDALLHAPCLSI